MLCTRPTDGARVIRPTREMREGARPVAGRAAAALVVALVLGLGVVPGAPGGGDGPSPAGAATTALRSLRTVDVSLGNVYSGSGTSEYFSSPALADLDKDDEPELVVAAPNGTVTATRLTTGARLWQRSLGATIIQTSPVVEDVDLDGRVDVVVGTMDGRVVMLDGQSGGVKRTFRQGAPLHCPRGVDCRPDGFFATPVVADVNGDGRKDIIAPSFDHTVYAWSHGGTLLWRAYLEDTLWSSPVVVDIDRNGSQEVVLGGDIYSGNPLGVPKGGLLWVLRGSNGTRFPGYPKSLPYQTIWSSPVVTDINGDGRLDAVVGTGSGHADSTNGRKVWAVTLTTRQGVPGWPVTPPGKVVRQPAVGDIDGDGRPEVVVGSEGGYVTAYEHTGARRWQRCNAVGGRCSDGYPTHGGAVIADVDADGVQEVVSGLDKDLTVYDGRNGAVEAQHRLTSGLTLAPPSIAAIGELQGRTVIVQSSILRSGSHGGARPGDRVRTDVLTTDRQLCAEDFPAHMRGPRRQAVLAALRPWNPFPCARPFVARQYRDILGRDLDVTGQTFWAVRLRSGWTGPRVVEGFMRSEEFQGVIAPVVRVHLGLSAGAPGPSSTIRDQVAAARQGATPAELARELLDARPAVGDARLVDEVWLRLVGAAPSAAERQAALDAIAASDQAAWVGSLTANPWVVARLRGQVDVAMAYVGLLDRAPDQSGWDHWVAQVGRGVSSQRLIELFLASAEYRDRVL